MDEFNEEKQTEEIEQSILPECLTINEAAAYYGIGRNKLRELARSGNYRFVLRIGTKYLIKRRLFDKFIEKAESL